MCLFIQWSWHFLKWMVLTMCFFFLEKMHHLFEKGARFPRTLKHHSKFQDGFVLCIWWFFIKSVWYSLKILEKCVESCVFSRNDDLLERRAIFSLDSEVYSKMYFFLHTHTPRICIYIYMCVCACSTLSEIIWGSLGVQGIILGSTLCKNDGNNWSRRARNSFILNKWNRFVRKTRQPVDSPPL